MDVGEKVAERFQVEAFIGAGGMGAVYRAKDEHTGAVVAIKSLLRADGDNERFARESRLLAELHHPGIVPYVAHGVTVEGERWLAMQWLEGEDLAERLDRSGLNLADALEVIRGAADALAAAHARGVVHRDVKPSNLFLEGGDPSRVRLLDFGIARDAGIARATLTGAVLGTPGYMAPEQARGEVGVGPAADVFSLGCVAFECLTATRPFVADHALAVVLRIVLEDAPRPRDRRADIPDDLDALVFEMLSKRPADRPKDAAEVARRLADVGAMPPSIRSRTLHLGAQPSLTEGEERLVSLVVAATMRRGPSPEVETALETAATVVTDGHLQSTGGSDRPPPELPGNVRVHDALAAWQRIAREHGAHTDVLADGLLVATLGGQGSAADQAARAARCALAFRAAVPHVPMVLTTGRRDVRTRAVVGEAIDRAVELLRIETARRDSDFIPRVAPAPVVTTVLLDDVSAALLDVRFEVGGEPKELRGERDRADEGRLLLGKKSPSVGRDRELTHLEALFDECRTEPKACAVVVTAPPGVGKSRLRSEVLARIGGRARSIWIGEGDAMRSGAPYAMIAPAVRRAAGIVHGEPLATSREKLMTRVSGIVPPADAVRTACFLGELCGVPFPDETSVELRAARHDPLVMGDQTRRAWSVLLEAETRAGPLVIVLEDLHWGDLPSVKLCDEALRDLRQRPFFVLALARPEVDDLFPQLWAKRGAHRIALGPLGRAASERLVTEALGSSVSAELVQRIAVRAGGNAFYLEELIRTVARAGGKWQDDLPETVLAMVEAHLDRLHPDARRILRAASVYGQTFWRSSALALLGGDARRSQMSDRIRELLDEEVILSGHSGRFPAEEEYVFQHALVRDAAYGTLTDEDRRLGHRLAATWLEQSGENDAMLMSEHHERAGDTERALSWLVRAASQAIEANDFDAAIARADRAIARGAKNATLGALRILQAEVHIWRSDHVRAEAALTEAMSVVPGGSALWCKGAAGVLAVHAHSGNIGELARMVEELRTTDPTEDARSAYVMPAAFVVSYAAALGMYPLAQAFLDRLVILGAGPHGFVADPIAEGWMRLAKRQRARFVAGDPWAYYVLGESAVESFERGGDARNGLLARAWWGHATLKLGRPAEAERQMRALLEKTADVGLHYVDATARIVLALSLAARGTSIDEACREAERATDLLARTNKVLGGFARTALATVRLRAGDLLGAEREARQAAESLFAARPYRAHALAVLGESLLGQGRAADAREVASEALAIVEALGAFEDAEALVRLVDAEARHASGDAVGANAAASMAWRRILARTATIPRGERSGFLEIREHTRTRQLLSS